jgi:hypothetical protein
MIIVWLLWSIVLSSGSRQFFGSPSGPSALWLVVAVLRLQPTERTQADHGRLVRFRHHSYLCFTPAALGTSAGESESSTTLIGNVRTAIERAKHYAPSSLRPKVAAIAAEARRGIRQMHHNPEYFSMVPSSHGPQSTRLGHVRVPGFEAAQRLATRYGIGCGNPAMP